jgi:transposase
MDYFAGLDISMDETHVCVLDREGVVVYESTTAQAHERRGSSRCRRSRFRLRQP